MAQPCWTRSNPLVAASYRLKLPGMLNHIVRKRERARYGAARARLHTKICLGNTAETTQFGASTTSLMRRFTATLHSA